jgi:hypothetical protein
MVENLERIKYKEFGRKLSLLNKVTIFVSEFIDRRKGGSLIGKQLLACEKDK